MGTDPSYKKIRAAIRGSADVGVASYESDAHALMVLARAAISKKDYEQAIEDLESARAIIKSQGGLPKYTLASIEGYLAQAKSAFAQRSPSIIDFNLLEESLSHAKAAYDAFSMAHDKHRSLEFGNLIAVIELTLSKTPQA